MKNPLENPLVIGVVMKVSIKDIKKAVSKNGGRFYTMKRDHKTVFVVNGREYSEKELISEFKEGYI